MKRISALVGVVLVLVLVPSAALASGGSSTCQAYGPQTCDSVSSGTAGTGNGSTTATTAAGTLPFTGLDIVLLVVGGGALLTGGFVVRRLSRRLN
jgi:hypothetical protein